MSLRLKLILALSTLAALAALAIGLTSYAATRNELYRRVDQSLDDAINQLSRSGRDDPGGVPNGDDHGPRFDQVVVQQLGPDGSIIIAPRNVNVPVEQADRDVADGAATSHRYSTEIKGEPYRILTVGLVLGGAVQVARSLRESQDALSAILRSTLLVVGLVVALASLVGWILGRQLTARLQQLTAAAENVADTGKLDVEVPVGGSDETARLGSAFNRMLGALSTSRQQQHQLVQDAGHELRTPLTSLRTNVSVLRRYESLPADQRTQVISDLDSESRELTSLVNELVELATDRRDSEVPSNVALSSLVQRAADRTRRRTGRDIVVVADDTEFTVQAAAVERAVQNLMDNAAKFAAHGPIDVTVASGSVSVRDHGAGIPPCDLDHVFDRFYRSVYARSTPGSGLGLSIVQSVVEQQGGAVFARNADDGGAIVGFSLPVRSNTG